MTTHDGEANAAGEFLRLPNEEGAPANAFFTEGDRAEAEAAIAGKRPIEPISRRLSALAREGVYPGPESQAAIYLRRIEGVAGYPIVPDL